MINFPVNHSFVMINPLFLRPVLHNSSNLCTNVISVAN